MFSTTCCFEPAKNYSYGLLTILLTIHFKQKQGSKDKAVWFGANSISGLEAVHGHTLLFHRCRQRLASIHKTCRATTLSQPFMERCHRQSAPSARKEKKITEDREASCSCSEELRMVRTATVRELLRWPGRNRISQARKTSNSAEATSQPHQRRSSKNTPDTNV